MSDKKANITYRVDVHRHEELKVIAARRRQSMQDMIEEGLDLVTKGKHTRTEYTPDELRLIDIVVGIAREHPKDYELLLGLLKNVEKTYEGR